MKNIVSLAFLILILSISVSSNGQTPTPTTTPKQPTQIKPADDEDIVRITTTLIQIDVVVTDKSGKVVTNLKPEDFEILENGKPQKITNFSFVTVEPPPAQLPTLKKNNSDKNTPPPPPPVKLAPNQVKRTIALVVDDLTLSFSSVYFVREALKKFVREQMQAGDIVAIIRTSGGISALQQFTSDKQQLYAAIERIKFNLTVGRISSFAPIRSQDTASPSLSSGLEADNLEVSNGVDEIERFRDDLFAVGTLGAVNYVVQGMRELPGRKAIMLLSEGFQIYNRSRDGNISEINSRVFDALKLLGDNANRAGIVIYTMDARGLQVTGLTAEDDVSGLSFDQVQARITERNNTLLDTQESLNLLAEQTGGFAIRNNNDISGGIRKVLDDQKSYYLIGYQPDAETFDPNKNRFNQLKVKLNKTGLKVRYRSGFFGIKDEDSKPEIARASDEQVMRALTSPFVSSDVSLRLTSIFGNDAKEGSFVRSLVHISAKDLTFTDKPDGSHETVVNVVAVTFGDSGVVVDSKSQTYTIGLKGKTYEAALNYGLVYSLAVPIKKAGAYQLRVAVRDDKSQKIGSANQFINVPDLKKESLALSGIVLSSFDPQKTDAANQQQPTGESSASSLARQAALRRFQSTQALQFGYIIYNAKLDKTTQQPQFTTQVKLFRDGKEIFAGREIPYTAKEQLDFERIGIDGGLQLSGLQEGEYVLQVIVKDALAKEKNRITTNWIDFEIVK